MVDQKKYPQKTKSCKQKSFFFSSKAHSVTYTHLSDGVKQRMVEDGSKGGFSLAPPPVWGWAERSNDYLNNFGLKSGTGGGKSKNVTKWLDIFEIF